MTRAELEHAIRAACDIAQDQEVYVFGSQAILGEHPDAPSPLRMSAEADIVPKNYPERWDLIDGAIGEDSIFHQTHHFYVQGVSMATAKLPPGWEMRCIEVRNANTRHYTGWCLEGHDLAASKLAACRDKDFAFVRTLILERMVHPKELLKRIEKLSVEEPVRDRITRWVQATEQEMTAQHLRR